MYASLCYLLSLFACVYGSYATFKVLKDEKREEDGAMLKHQLQYWVVISLLYLYEYYVEFLFCWIPFYYSVKCILQVWIIVPQLKGANVLYEHVVVPNFQLVKAYQEEVVSPVGQKTLASCIHGVQTFAIASLARVATEQELANLKQNLSQLQTTLEQEVIARKVTGETHNGSDVGTNCGSDDSPQVEETDSLDETNAQSTTPTNEEKVSNEACDDGDDPFGTRVVRRVSQMFWSAPVVDAQQPAEGALEEDDMDFDEFLMQRYDNGESKTPGDSERQDLVANVDEIVASNEVVVAANTPTGKEDTEHLKETLEEPTNKPPPEQDATPCKTPVTPPGSPSKARLSTPLKTLPDPVASPATPRSNSPKKKHRVDSLNSTDFEELFGSESEEDILEPTSGAAESSTPTNDEYKLPSLQSLFSGFFQQQSPLLPPVPSSGEHNDVDQGEVKKTEEAKQGGDVVVAGENVVGEGEDVVCVDDVEPQLVPDKAVKPIIATLVSDDEGDPDFSSDSSSSESEDGGPPEAPRKVRSPYVTRSKAKRMMDQEVRSGQRVAQVASIYPSLGEEKVRTSEQPRVAAHSLSPRRSGRSVHPSNSSVTGQHKSYSRRPQSMHRRSSSLSQEQRRSDEPHPRVQRGSGSRSNKIKSTTSAQAKPMWR